MAGQERSVVLEELAFPDYYGIFLQGIDLVYTIMYSRLVSISYITKCTYCKFLVWQVQSNDVEELIFPL